MRGATSAKVRKFLYELAEGTCDYRSLHNLTEQVEHQYHGRFVVELIQNAHDALLPRRADADHAARIAIAITDQGPHGALFVANDGQPFSESNFESLSQLGNSDKDPQDSIGNKGIGFRSVLEVTVRPSIFSRSVPGSETFDGFCFGFAPDTIDMLRVPVARLADGDDDVTSPLGGGPLVDWGSSLLDKFRASVRDAAVGTSVEEWVGRELAYLSPYLLPFPIVADDRPAAVDAYERCAFATVICLPFKSQAARELACKQLKSLDASALLFLDRATSLTVDAGDGWQRDYTRGQARTVGDNRGAVEVALGAGAGTLPQRYFLWTRTLPVSDAPEEIREALRQLPGRWPELRDASVSIGVRVGDVPEVGRLTIFLPTRLGTGCGAHINGSFFGDMSRTSIDFGDEGSDESSTAAVYNRYLFAAAARLSLSVIAEELAGRGEDEARAIVDLLAPTGHAAASQRWQNALADAAEQQGVSIPTAPWLLSDRGWTPLNGTSLVPTLSDPSVLTPACIRQHATYAAFSAGLESRRAIIKALSNVHGFGADPLPDVLAETIEVVAQRLQEQADVDWNAFWSEVRALLGADCSLLAGKRVLLGQDGELHASGEGCAVFFLPRRGGRDDEEVDNEQDVQQVPPGLRSSVAFLSDRIRTSEERDGRQHETLVRRTLLDSKLVSRFRREDIFTDVLIPMTPELPLPLEDRRAGACRDILHWGLRLLALLVDRGGGGRLFQLLRDLPAPCHGGWYPLAQTAFGSGWEGTQGAVAQGYLARANSPLCREVFGRLLLPPDHSDWGGDGLVHLPLLRKAGVFDGLPLVPIEPDDWASRFDVYGQKLLLPPVPPARSGWPRANWDAYRDDQREANRPNYQTGRYRVGRLLALPGAETYAEFDTDTRLAFMDAVLASAARWADGWRLISVERVQGNRDRLTLASPTAWALRRARWLGIGDEPDLDWFRPADRWHVPSRTASGRRASFAHLSPLPGRLADQLDKDPRLAAVMYELGMPLFAPDPESRSSDPRLLDALADAADRGETGNRDVFLGQVRAAWGAFEPGNGGASFPGRVLVQDGGSTLTVRSLESETPILLPDSEKFLDVLRQFEFSMLAIEPKDAKRLAEPLLAAFPKSFVAASSLRPVALVDGQRWFPRRAVHLQDDERLGWLIPVLLSVAAQGRGTETKRFREQVKILREARVEIVGELKIALAGDDSSTGGQDVTAASHDVLALWDDDSGTLLLRNPTQAEFPQLSEALSSMLGREDLEVAIKLVLRETGVDPQERDILRALGQLRITEGHYREVREHWRGDVWQLIDRLVPLVLLLCPDADIGELAELTTDDAVRQFLARLGDPRIDSFGVASMARESADMFAFGLQTFERLGDIAQLWAWNAVLQQRGEQTLVNRNAKGDFRSHFNAALPALRSLLATLLVRDHGVGTFPELSGQLDAIQCPEWFATTLWEVRFQDVMSRVAGLLVSWGASEEIVDAVRSATSADELIERLGALGCDTNLDPTRVHRDNRARLQGALLQLQRIGLAWAIETEQPDPERWQSKTESWLATLSQAIEETGYFTSWDDAAAWRLIRGLPVDAASPPFWEAVGQAAGSEDLICQSASKIDPQSASNFDPPWAGRVFLVWVAPSEPA